MAKSKAIELLEMKVESLQSSIGYNVEQKRKAEESLAEIEKLLEEQIKEKREIEWAIDRLRINGGIIEPITL